MLKIYNPLKFTIQKLPLKSKISKMKTLIYQYCFSITNLTKVYCHQLISYSIAQFALMHPLLNHKLNMLPPKQQLNQKPRIDYQP